MDIEPNAVEDQTGAIRAFITEDVMSDHTSAFLDNRCFGDEDLDKDDLSFDRESLWDPNILLSNAGPCELNPLFDVGNSVHDDYDRLFSEWDNSSFIQSSSDLQFGDDGLVMKNQELFFDDLKRSLPNNSATTKIKQEPGTERVDTLPLITSAANGKLKLGMRSVAGIVISSGPGAHFATFEVIEEQDVDRLLDELDSFSNLMDDNEMLSKATHLRDLDEATQIVEAVQNHFSHYDKSVGVREIKNPKIVPSQKIKDALPKEIIESIRASSIHSRTIAIVEPINRKLEVDEKSVSSFVKPEPSLRKPLGLTTRFQEAAANLSRTNKVRQILLSPTLKSGNQGPVTLDHDYCTSGSRVGKRSNMPTRESSSISVSKTKQNLIKEKKFQKTTTLKQGSSLSSSLSQSTEPRSVFQMVSSRPSISAISQFRNRMAPAQIRLEKTRSSSKPFTKMAAPTITVAQSTCNYSDLSTSVFGAPDSPLTYDVSSDSIKAEITDYDYDASADFFSVSHDLPKTPQKAFDVKVNKGLHSALLNMAEDDNLVENDTKKDSGLESGEVSDSSESDPNAPGNREYIKVPSLHSSALKKSSRKSIEESSGCFDRLPAYVKGIPSGLQLSTSPKNSNVTTTASTVVLPAKSTRRLSRSRSPLKKPILSPVRHSARLNRQRSFSSASTSSSSSCDTRPEPSSRSRKRSFQRRFLRHRSNSRSKSPPPPLAGAKHRTRTLATQPSQKLIQEEARTVLQQEIEVEERRIVYVGKISEGTTRADLRKRFEKFGPILEISLHFRDRGDNYGFVTFKYKSHAFEAIEHGNDDPNLEKVHLCFGGRRTFCKERYSDLDYTPTSGTESFPSNHFDALLRQAQDGLSVN